MQARLGVLRRISIIPAVQSPDGVKSIQRREGSLPITPFGPRRAEEVSCKPNEENSQLNVALHCSVMWIQQRKNGHKHDTRRQEPEHGPCNEPLWRMRASRRPKGSGRDIDPSSDCVPEWRNEHNRTTEYPDFISATKQKRHEHPGIYRREIDHQRPKQPPAWLGWAWTECDRLRLLRAGENYLFTLLIPMYAPKHDA